MVDEELNQGRWVDGYDLAVSRNVINGDDARKLLQNVLAQHPELRIDEEALRRVIEVQVPQYAGADFVWIVDECGAFALTDSLRVARFDGASITWKSPRISHDGIALDRLQNGKVYGRAWLLGSNGTRDSPFVLDFQTGGLLSSYVVEP